MVQPWPGITTGLMAALDPSGTRGVTYVAKFGRNLDVDAMLAAEDVWNGGGEYTGFPTGSAETVSVFSASAADAAAGTGMRTLQLVGLSSAGLDQTETITMNGTTPVVSTKTWLRIHRVTGLTGGSGATNAGDITVRHTTTTANVFAVLPAGFSQSAVAAYTVPANRRGAVVRFALAASSGSATTEELTGALMTRTSGSSLWRVRRPVITSTSTPRSDEIDGGLTLDPLTDIKVRVLTATNNNLTVSAKFDIVLLD